MKILVVSNTPWRKDTPFGNTFINLFENFSDVEVASVYCRYGKTATPIVSRAFQITEKSLIHNLKNKAYPSGKEVFIDADNEIETEQPKSMDFARKNRWTLLFWARDFIWSIGKWKSKELTDFVDSFKPDIIFQPVYYPSHINKIALYLKKYTGVPMYGYISDDNFTLRQFSWSPLYWIDRLLKRRIVKKLVNNCELLYCISKIQKEDCEKAFDCKCKILTKSADFSEEMQLKDEYNEPLQLVYTGGIGMNRWKSLAVVADALREINKDGVKAQLKIYSGTPVTKKMRDRLEISGSSFFMGFVSSDEVCRIQHDADLLLHVEAFDLKNKLKVRQSFSTKLVDYMKMCRPILAVGPKDVASISHLADNKCAIIAENKDELKAELLNCINNRSYMDNLVRNAYECGRKYHDKSTVKEMLYNDIYKK